uniref:Uncharacterized protein n=1 Tax=Cyclophora tenuis TaxID=216820 RepID=A0A7S1GS33_CYCTE
MQASMKEIEAKAEASVAKEKASCEEASELLKKEHSDQVLVIQKESEAVLSASESSRDQKIELLTRTVSEMEANHTANVASLSAEKERHVADLDANYKAAVSGLKETHEKEKAKLEALMQETELQSQKEIESVNTSLTKQLQLLRQTSEKDLTEATARHDKMKSDLEATIAALQEKEVTVKGELKALQEQLTVSTEELREWEERHSVRSYCNLTHIHEDTAATLLSASKVAGEQVYQASKVASTHVSKAAEPHLKKGKELYDQHLKDHVDKHYETGRQLYDTHLRTHVERHIVPLHDSHVIPGVAFVGEKLGEAGDAIADAQKAVFASLVVTYKQGCQKAKGSLDGWMLDVANSSCKDPETMVEVLLWATVIIALFLLRRVIWRTLKGIVWLKLMTIKAIIMLKLKTLWYMTLLPLVFRLFRRNKTPPPMKTKPTPNGAVLSNGTASLGENKSGKKTGKKGGKKAEKGPSQ